MLHICVQKRTDNENSANSRQTCRRCVYSTMAGVAGVLQLPSVSICSPYAEGPGLTAPRVNACSCHAGRGQPTTGSLRAALYLRVCARVPRSMKRSIHEMWPIWNSPASVVGRKAGSCGSQGRNLPVFFLLFVENGLCMHLCVHGACVRQSDSWQDLGI